MRIARPKVFNVLCVNKGKREDNVPKHDILLADMGLL